MKAVFSAWDTDADGAVSTGEFRKGLRDKQRAFNQARVQQFVASLDRNQDGSIEAGEIAPLRPPEALLDFLAAFDTQGDGRLDPGEIQTMQPFVNPMIDKRMFALNAGLVRLPHPQRQQVERLPPMVQAIFLMANENDDEALTQEEYTGYLRDVLGQAAADIVINQTPLPVPVEESPSGGVASAQTSGLTASSPRGAGEPGNPGSRRGFRSLLTTPGGPDHSVPDALRRGGGEGMDRDLLW